MRDISSTIIIIIIRYIDCKVHHTLTIKNPKDKTTRKRFVIAALTDMSTEKNVLRLLKSQH